MSGQHARLSASSAYRWFICPGSIPTGGGDGGASIHAATGTFAHDILAKCLADSSLSPSDFLLKRASVDGFDVECDMEMVEAVGVCLQEIADDLEPGDKTWIEMPLLDALRVIDPDLGGTADFVRYRPATRHLRVLDYKHGSGTYVEVEDNKQTKVYALGAMLEVREPVDTVELVIVQPRFEGAKPVRTFSFKAFELLDFAADIVDAAKRTREPNPVRVAGEHCKFCPSAWTKAGPCPELEKRKQALIAADFPVLAAEPAKLAEALAEIPLVKARIKALEEHAYQEAMRGVDIPGMKLVEKRPVRSFKNDGDVIEWAQGAGIDPFLPRELRSPAQMEAILKEKAPRGKKKEACAVLEPFIQKVSSGLVLVPIADERPAYKRLTNDDFAAVDGTADTKQQPPVFNLF